MLITQINNFTLKNFNTHPKRLNNTPDNKINFTAKIPQDLYKKIKHTAIAALFLVPVAGGIVHSCGDNVKKDSQGIEYIDKKADTDKRSDYIDSSSHKVEQGETLYSIAKKYDVSVEELKSINGIGEDNLIKSGQILKIPVLSEVKNIKNISDVSKVTGLSKNYLAELEKIENPKGEKSIYYDNNGNPNVGAGHKVLKSEISKYQGREISDEEKYTLLAGDLLVREEKIKEIIAPEVYDDLPALLRENVFDFVYHRGETAFKQNKALVDGLNNKNYSKAVANLYKNYTMSKKPNGQPYEKHMAGLCKRSLIRMGNASKIFKDGIPEEVLKSARATYEEGLRLLKEETNQGKISQNAYPNVLAEYQDIAYNLFDGKIGVKTGASKNLSILSEELYSEIVSPAKVTPAAGSTPVYVSGIKIDRTKQQIEADWANNAKRYARLFTRPELVLDNNGNVSALIKVITPKKRGVLSGKTIIVNQGHGGCAANSTSPNNTNFDPGCSNAVMEPVKGADSKFKRNKHGELILVESNKFIGNGGKALEEWKVNEMFANDLIEKLSNSGAKIIFISGEVHNAQNAIRKIERENRINLFVSLHSNSSETVVTKVGRNGQEYVSQRITKRGFFIMPNNRGGLDQEDYNLAKSINKEFQQEPWLVGLGDIQSKSLGVLSSSRTQTSPVPGVLIETGNLKHETDVANLNSREFRRKLVDATYNGIVDYLAK